ncbi:MAG: hypothetical protein OEZ68_12005 [Gammaproteobacteria bacterium]|nr:hypothetical protein [Gammaproteobacteria bacterium]MDH5801517.1 hypothetical protein [Gammaproteobacteria bacterium]
MEPSDKTKRLLQQASDLDHKARRKRIEAGKLIHEHGPTRWNGPALEAYGISSEGFAQVLVGMHLNEIANKARPKIQKRKPVI